MKRIFIVLLILVFTTVPVFADTLQEQEAEAIAFVDSRTETFKLVFYTTDSTGGHYYGVASNNPISVNEFGYILGTGFTCWKSTRDGEGWRSSDVTIGKFADAEYMLGNHDVYNNEGALLFRGAHWVESLNLMSPMETMTIVALITIPVCLGFLAFRKSWALLRNQLKGC